VGVMALLKLFLMAFSFVFWAAGLTMLTIGVWAKISLGTYLVLSTNEYPNTPFILLATGTAVIVWGFVGCFSAATEHRCLLRTYGSFQLAVLVAGLAAGLSSLFYRKDIAEGFQNGLREAIRSYTEDEEKAEALDSIQRMLDCCGAPNGSVPVSCSDARGIFHEGCFSKVYDFVSDNVFYIATAALGLALMQVVGIVLSCLLASRILPHAEPQRGAIPH
uniref:Tetraspanin n=1 Tax=Varanus komodoensis TaxID=61221 RepID=A0A8D2LN44_VARKO